MPESQRPDVRQRPRAPFTGLSVGAATGLIAGYLTGEWLYWLALGMVWGTVAAGLIGYIRFLRSTRA